MNPSPHTQRWLWITGLLSALLAGIFYVRTLHPGVGPYLDSIQYQIVTLVMGVSHPPGYPLFTWLGALFVHGLPFNNPAYRLNLLSAVTSAVTVLLIQRVNYRLTRSVAIATLGALLLAFAVRFWYQATYTELYPLYNTFVAAEWLALLAFMETKQPRYYFLSAALYALSFGVNAPAIVLLPMWLWAVLSTDHRMLTRPKNFAFIALIVLVAAAQYFYIPLRAFADPPAKFCNFCPRTWAELPDFLTGKRWWGISFGLPPKYWLQRWADSGYQLMLQFWPVGVMAGGVGLWALFRRQARVAVTCLLGLAGVWFFVSTYNVVDWDDFMTPVCVFFAPLIAVGIQDVWLWLRARLDARRPSFTPLVRAMGILLIAVWVVLITRNNYPLVDQSRKTDWHAWARDLLPQFEDGAWLLTPPTPTDGFVQTWVLRYISWAENLHPEMTVVYVPGGEFDPPGPPPGYITWKEAEPHLREHPVYLIELNDERVHRYVLLPVRRYDDWIIGYRIVGERTAQGIEPWVDEETWADIQDEIIMP